MQDPIQATPKHLSAKGERNPVYRMENSPSDLQKHQKNAIRKSTEREKKQTGHTSKDIFPPFFHGIPVKKNHGEIRGMLHTYVDSAGRPCAGLGAAGIK